MSYQFHKHLRKRHPNHRYHSPLDMYQFRQEYRQRRRQNLHCFQLCHHLYPTIQRNLEEPNRQRQHIHQRHRQYLHCYQYHRCQYQLSLLHLMGKHRMRLKHHRCHRQRQLLEL